MIVSVARCKGGAGKTTIFGLRDLKIAVNMLDGMKIPYGVVVNMGVVGGLCVRDYCRENDVKVLAEMPHDMDAAGLYSMGETFADEMPDALEEIGEEAL